MIKLNIEQIHELAKSRGGECLSTEYINSENKLLWKCGKEHTWKTNYRSIRMRHWCPECAGLKKLSIEQMNKIAENRGGLCLSKHYVNSQTKLKWRCKEGHIWNATPAHINFGKWCPKCGIQKMLLNRNGPKKTKTLEEMKILAISRNGICLSNKYINISTKLKWKCENKHIFFMRPNDIKRGCWCQKCGYKKTGIKNRCLIDEIYNIAKERNGLCLSKKYNNTDSKLKWKCENNHIWIATPHSIKNGTWCPHCKPYKSELLCKKYLENITKLKFIKCKPKWLNGLELDGYCKELNIAFEYQGEQHYKHVKYFHDKKDFNLLLKRDKLKEKLCKQNNVKLIIIPYIYNIRSQNKLCKFIDSQL